MKIKNFIKRAVMSIRIFFEKRNKLVIIKALEKLPINFFSLTLIDIGAANDIEPRWKRIEQVLNYVGFEPNPESRLELLSTKNNCLSYKLLPYGISVDNEILQINICRSPGVSSLFKPNYKFLELFPDSERFDILSNVKIECRKIDDCEIEIADFIKIDIQGGELNALRGGEKLLKKTLGLEIEVEFIELYKAQPLFCEITSYLKKFDFEFIDFVNLCRWERNAFNGFGQCIFGDAIFLKTPEFIIKNYSDKLVISKYLAILLLYNRFDLIDRMNYLIPEEQKTLYLQFMKKIIRIRRKNNIIRKFIYGISIFLSFVGLEYRVHLLN